MLSVGTRFGPVGCFYSHPFFFLPGRLLKYCIITSGVTPKSVKLSINYENVSSTVHNYNTNLLIKTKNAYNVLEKYDGQFVSKYTSVTVTRKIHKYQHSRGQVYYSAE